MLGERERGSFAGYGCPALMPRARPFLFPMAVNWNIQSNAKVYWTWLGGNPQVSPMNIGRGGLSRLLTELHGPNVVALRRSKPPVEKSALLSLSAETGDGCSNTADVGTGFDSLSRVKDGRDCISWRCRTAYMSPETRSSIFSRECDGELCECKSRPTPWGCRSMLTCCRVFWATASC